MIDMSVDADFAALERADSQKETAPVRRRAPATLATLPSVPSGELSEVSTATTTSTFTPPPDPVGHLQTARLGFAAAVVLVLYLLWIRERRKTQAGFGRR